MLTLILMRHAKSSWGNPGLADHDRPLNQRGISSAEALGQWLKLKNYLPDEALVSSSRRTQDTFKLLDLQTRPTIQSDLFHASSDILLSSLRQATGQCILIVAHNPGIGALALRLAQMSRKKPSHSRFSDYPTGATFITQYKASNWAELDFSSGNIIDFITPKDVTPKS